MEPFALAPAAERLQTVFRTRPWLLDTAVAVLVVVVGAISRPTLSFITWSQTVYTLIVVGCAAALVFRRLFPRPGLTVIAILLLGHLVAAIEPGLCVALICLIAAYTTQTQLTPPWRWVFLAAIYGGTVAAIMTSPIPAVDVRGRLIVTGVVLTLLTLAALTGVIRRQRRTRYTLAVERANMLEAQQDADRRLAAVEERTRIAREMHDILGHSLNAIAAQAEGVRYVLRSDADRADQALADIGWLSRRAVDDVRDLIDVLTTDAAQTSVLPTPSLGDMPELIASLRYTKAAIRLQFDGDVDAVPGHVGLAAYRIVQESLTNALKHADGVPITVRVTVQDRHVEVAVLNPRAPAVPLPGTAAGGRGIIGMRERARALGGAVEAGPDPATGGWRVRATLPRSRA
ncbi:histidine kinase [Polymorphospora sp. NPDC050346]|uniref:sensor histidine kinase n=1 Tax=Polymorphospora sp. NPDC050346 TaxID=3155780 RepID=UPI0033F37AA3